MNSYLVYQLPFEHPKKRDMSFLTVGEFEELSAEYEVVAEVKAKNLDEVFRIGNFVSENDMNQITFLGEMHSISVGDIIANVNTGEEVVVGSYGFSAINMKEAV